VSAEGKRRFPRGTGPHAVASSDGAENWREPTYKRLGRRLISIPGLLLVVSAYLALLPLLLVYSVIADGIRRRSMLLARTHLTIAGILFWHLVGGTGLFLWWLAGFRWLGLKPKNWVDWNRNLEGWWGHWVIGIGEIFYGMTMDIRGEQDALGHGPVLVFARHTSIIDTMLPLRVLEYRNDMNARIVKKQVLLWDPCVDSISNRIPRTFVRRGGDPEADIERVRRLALNMGDNDGVWIFPEGTRFSPKKRAQVINRLREKGNEAAAERAEELEYVLPPRPGGALALLDQCKGVDVVFCAHTGMEGANRLENFINGSLFRRKIEVELWRVSADEVPEDPEERIEWLHGWWKRMDHWVAEHQDRDLTELLASEAN
jgi:1-acyl-sn-glycerol-3-phosphate acyltransferase